MFSYIQSLEDRVAYLESRLADRESLDFQSTSEDCPPMPPSERSSSGDPIEQVVSKSLDADVFTTQSQLPTDSPFFAHC